MGSLNCCTMGRWGRLLSGDYRSVWRGISKDDFMTELFFLLQWLIWISERRSSHLAVVMRPHRCYATVQSSTEQGCATEQLTRMLESARCYSSADFMPIKKSYSGRWLFTVKPSIHSHTIIHHRWAQNVFLVLILMSPRQSVHLAVNDYPDTLYATGGGKRRKEWEKLV